MTLYIRTDSNGNIWLVSQSQAENTIAIEGANYDLLYTPEKFLYKDGALTLKPTEDDNEIGS